MRGAILAAVLVVCGCMPNAEGFGSVGDSMPAPEVAGASTSSGLSSGPSSSLGAAQGSGDPQSDDPTASGAPAGSPEVNVEGDNALDFGPVSLGDSATVALTIRNDGTADATDLGATPLSPPFGYAGGGPFPGAGGDCGATLFAGEACVIELAFTPSGLGDHDGALVLTVDGDAVLDHPVRGAGVGVTDNLLSNPGGEEVGSPPPSWINLGAGTWASGTWIDEVTIFDGDGYLHASEGPSNENFDLGQSVALSEWTPLVDAEALFVGFTAQARTHDVDNDEYRIRVQAFDVDQTRLANWRIEWQTGAQWREHRIRQPIPAGTRSLRVVLGCRKASGDHCDAYFDAIELRVGTR